MPLDLREATTNLVRQGLSDADVNLVLDQIEKETVDLVKQGLPDAEIEKRLGAANFKGIPLFSTPSAAPDDVAMRKTAAPYDPSFLGTLSREFGQGFSTATSGITEPQHPLLGVGKMVLGGAQMAGAPFAAAGAVLGENIGEPVRAALQPSLGVDASSAIGATVGASANVASQFLALPAALSKLAPYGMKLIQATARVLPGSQVALRELGKDAIARIPSALKPPVSADDLFREVRDMKGTVQLPLFKREAQKIARTEAKLSEFGLSNAGAEGAAGDIASALSTPVKTATKFLGDEFEQVARTKLTDVPFDVVMKVRQRIGDRIGELRRSGGEELGEYKQLFRALSEDLEKSSKRTGGPFFAKLKEANAAANREFALGELDDVFNATMGRAREAAEFTSSNFAQALNKIRDLRRSDPLFEKGMGAENLKTIEGNLDELRKLKALPAAKGVNVGSALVNTRIGAGGGLGFAIGTMIGGPTMGAVVGGAGSFAAAIGPPIISRIVQSKAGTQSLIRVLESEGQISAKSLASIFSIMAAESAVRNKLADEVKASLKTPEMPIAEKIKMLTDKNTIFTQGEQAKAAIEGRDPVAIGY